MYGAFNRNDEKWANNWNRFGSFHFFFFCHIHFCIWYWSRSAYKHVFFIILYSSICWSHIPRASWRTANLYLRLLRFFFFLHFPRWCLFASVFFILSVSDQYFKGKLVILYRAAACYLNDDISLYILHCHKLFLTQVYQPPPLANAPLTLYLFIFYFFSILLLYIGLFLLPTCGYRIDMFFLYSSRSKFTTFDNEFEGVMSSTIAGWILINDTTTTTSVAERMRR